MTWCLPVAAQGRLAQDPTPYRSSSLRQTVLRQIHASERRLRPLALSRLDGADNVAKFAPGNPSDVP